LSISTRVFLDSSVFHLKQVQLSLRVASQDLPEELSELIANHPGARKAWNQLTAGQQIREEIRAAKLSATRLRRARKALG